MVTITIASQKGGVGKTTLALNLSYAFAVRGWNTLLVDTDPQSGIGYSVRGGSQERLGLYDVLENQFEPEQVILRTRQKNLSMLPIGNLPVSHLESWHARLGEEASLRGIFQSLPNDMDLIIVDTPSGLGGPTTGALKVADYLLVPLQAEPLALRSMPLILEMVNGLKERGYPVQLAGFVLTMLHSRQEISLSIAQEAWKKLPGKLVLETFIPRDKIFLEASAAGVPLALMRKRPPSISSVFDQLASELEEVLGLQLDEGDDKPISLLD
jgi:chromosome partitioning protein